MSQVLPQPSSCCTPCSDAAINTQIPGPAGADGADGAAGADGADAYTETTDDYAQPAVSANVSVEVASSEPFALYMDVFIEGGGYYRVEAIPDGTHLTLQNRGYTANSAPATVIGSGARVTTAGEKGETGLVDANGALLVANDLSDLNDPPTAVSNLGASAVGANLFSAASLSAVSFILVNADDTVTLRTAGNFRSDLSLVPGTNVQVYDAFLTSIAALGTAADKMIYTTAADTAAETAITSLGRSLVGGADEAAMRSTLGKILPRYGLLAAKTGFNVNSAGSDNAITVEASRYRIDKITVDNASINLTTATAGVFTAAGGGGTTVAADQALSALTASTKFDDLTLDAGIGTDVLTAGTLYARCGTAQGAAATCDLRVWGWRLD